MPNTSDLVKKTDCNRIITETENKRLSTTSLVTLLVSFKKATKI